MFYGNHFIAYVGGIQLGEMNLLESEFLNYIDWKIWVDSAEYDFYFRGVQKHFEQAEKCQQTQSDLVPQGPQSQCSQAQDMHCAESNMMRIK